MNKIIIILFFILPLISFSQTDTIEIKGVGNSCKEATNDALANAINQAYGSLIYTRTEIKNDSLISDEITTLQSGNILSYKELSNCIINADKWSITLSVTLSKAELRKFVEGKGKSVPIEGPLFVQKLNQECSSIKSELGIIKNLLQQLEPLTIEPFDYEINITQINIIDGKNCVLPADIEIKSNANFFNIGIKLFDELDKISINDVDRKFRDDHMPKDSVISYPITINSKLYNLRNYESVALIDGFYKKVLSKIDAYTVVDDCLKELFIQEKSKSNKLKKYEIFFPDPGFIVKTISGKFNSTIDEIGGLNRINIFASYKLADYKKGKSLTGEMTMMKYSETNPIEYQTLKDNILIYMQNVSVAKSEGEINLKYDIKISNLGKNESEISNLNTSESEIQNDIKKILLNYSINPSRLCGNYIKTTDNISMNLAWKTVTEKYTYSNKNSEYSNWFSSKKLPYGSYLISRKEKILNGTKFSDVAIKDYKVRSASNALYSVILPGWGKRRITYNNKNGWGAFSMVIIPLSVSLLTNIISDNSYNKYKNSQSQNDIDKYYKQANNYHHISIVSTGIATFSYFAQIFDVYKIARKSFNKRNEIRHNVLNGTLQIQNQPITLQ